VTAFKDIATQYLFFLPAAQKSDYLEGLRHVITYFKTRDWKPRILRTDSERVLLAADVVAHLSEEGMVPQASAPYAHYQNSVERDVQTLNRGVSTMLEDQLFLGKNLWDLAVFHYTDVRNRTPNQACPLSSPDQVINRRSTDLSRTHDFAWGDVVRVRTPPELRKGRFDLAAKLGIFVGVPEGYVNASLVYWPTDKSTSVRTDVERIDIAHVDFLKYLERQRIKSDGPLSYKTFKDAVINFLPEPEVSSVTAVDPALEETTVAVISLLLGDIGCEEASPEESELEEQASSPGYH
jgi:hypothetical protein